MLLQLHTIVMAGLVPATPLNKARPCHMIGVAGISPAMTVSKKESENSHPRPIVWIGAKQP
jgi:hypothetical protein